MNRHVNISSKLEPDKILKRIQESVDSIGFKNVGFFQNGRLVDIKGRKPFLGRVFGCHCTIRKRIDYSNSMIPVFVGRVVKDEVGSRILGRFTICLSIKLMYVILMIVVWLFFGSLAIETGSAALLVFPTILTLFSIWVLYWGHHIFGEQEEVATKQFLQDLANENYSE